jgi:hypothetical protein
MGIDLKKGPPLPAPTETDSPTATELTTDVSKATDSKSSYSLPEDGSVTIRTRDRHRSKGTAVLIEYFEGGQPGASGSGSDRKPSVRVRLTPSKRGKNDHIHITETQEASRRKTSLSRRTPLSPTTPAKAQADFAPGDDDHSISSYASATEESNVSRNPPIEVGIDLRGSRRRRPASPLIPASETMSPFQQQSEISAIPTDSFLDGLGPTRTPEGKRVHTPSSDKIKPSKQRERVKISDKAKEKAKSSERKPSKSKSRTSSLSEKEREKDRVDSPRRRSSRSHQESVVSGGDSSVVSSNLSPSHRSYETGSVRSGSSKSINNPRLLETVEDAIRRLILPEINAIKREQSRRESSRRGSAASGSASGSREDIESDRRRSSGKLRESRHRDRESHHRDYAASPRPYDEESHDGSSIRDASRTPKRSGDRIKAAAAGLAAGGLVGAAAANARRDTRSPASDTRERRKRRSETPRSQSRASDAYTEDYDDDRSGPTPPMPLMSEINPSEVTRASIRSADTYTERPLSAADEVARPTRASTRGSSSLGSTPTPTKTPIDLQHGLGTQHANISRGDLAALRPSKRDDAPAQPIGHQVVRQPDDVVVEMEPDETQYNYYHTQDPGLPPHIKYEPYQPERRGLSPIYSVSGYTEGGSEAQRDSRTTNESESPGKSSGQDASMHSPSSIPSNVVGREFDQRSDDRSVRSSTADYRNTTSTDDSELERVTSGQAIRGVGANPDISYAPVGLESQVASLIDGSMLDASVLSGGVDYATPRDPAISSEELSTRTGNRNVSPRKQSYDSRGYIDDRDVSVSPVSAEFPLEYEPDQYGRKIPQATVADRHSPSESERAAIAQSAVQSAIKRIKEREAKPVTLEDKPMDDWVGAGVGRNKSFKDRTLEGREPANTPAHSIDRFEFDDDRPKLGASGLPDLNHPMPEIGFVDDALTEPSLAGGDADVVHGDDDDDYDEGRATPKPIARERPRNVLDHETAAILETAAAFGAMTHSRQPSQEQDEEWHRTSDDKKRDTMGTNPFEGISPVAHPRDHIFGATSFGLGFNTGSPGGMRLEDEGYKSQDPNRTPDLQAGRKALADPSDGGDIDNPFYEPRGHARHFSGGSHGMTTSFYHAATGGGMDNIENKDIMALMQNVSAAITRSNIGHC